MMYTKNKLECVLTGVQMSVFALVCVLLLALAINDNREYRTPAPLAIEFALSSSTDDAGENIHHHIKQKTLTFIQNCPLTLDECLDLAQRQLDEEQAQMELVASR